MKGWRVWAAAGFALMSLGGVAQAQGRDPFQGRFGAMEVALPAPEALRQQEVFQQGLAGLAPQRPGVLDVYVLSIALWGEPVFEREASQAGEILTRHFGAQGRSLVLTQGAAGVERRFAAATPHHIQSALARIGALMDPNEDLFVLFVTSHGSSDGAMSMLDPGRLAGALRPGNLRQSLNEAGLRNRLVIISACFSGAFIAPLMDDRTMVLTAAASDRSSFGCQPNREWTYFGDAYFGHALRGGANVTTAFDQAVRLIAQWEREQGLTPPSNPQRFIGPQAAQLVARAERQAQR